MWKILTALLLFVTGFVLTATPAEAHPEKFRQGNDIGWVSHGYTTDDTVWEHRKVTINDHECDGNQTYMQYIRSGSDERYILVDRTGCTGGPSVWNYHTKPGKFKIIWARICENDPGVDTCKSWRRIYDTLQA